jgi:hypothetical protein
MLSTKCERCFFAKPGTEETLGECSQNIIEKIKEHKKITQENNYNIIEEYACRYGFAKEVYENNKDNLKDLNLLEHIEKNAQYKYYLIIDIINDITIENIIKTINNLSNKPTFISFLFRDTGSRFTEQDKKLLVNTNLAWKAHNFVENIDLASAIDHILSTNIQNSRSSHFLVYNSIDINQLPNDIMSIHNNLIIYQIPHIAMVKYKDMDTLYGIFMGFDNYKIAKTIDDGNLLEIIKNESQILKF